MNSNDEDFTRKRFCGWFKSQEWSRTVLMFKWFVSSTSGIPASCLFEDMIDPIQRFTIQESSAISGDEATITGPFLFRRGTTHHPTPTASLGSCLCLRQHGKWIFRTHMESHGMYLVYTLHRQIHRFFENIEDDDGQHVGF